ncbi:MAG: pyridoxal phosphate-dependent aminotransferase [Rhizobiaceae bacterium]|nr:pyridoxal phosphate-dependent aminotransferase [Rhizobiaceae bacterium]
MTAGSTTLDKPLLFSPLARSLPATVPFVGPEALERRFGVHFKARLGANESVFGPSPKAVAAMAEAAAKSWAYGDPEQFELKAALAGHLGVKAANITVGEGIDGLFGLLLQVATSSGDRVLSSKGAYPTFAYHVAGHGALLDTVPYRDARPAIGQDIDALVETARRTRPKLLYVSNPDNPTGSWVAKDLIEQLIADVPEETIIVLDEAYSDLAPAAALPDISLVRPNLLRFRTFSKAYGMAGVRVGYAIGEADTVRQFDKVRNHFGVSRIAQAGAMAALSDSGHLSSTISRIVAARDRLSEIALEAGLVPLPSATNFVAIDCGRDGDFARALLAAILQEGVFIRMPGIAPLDRMIRVTVGTDEDLALFAAALHTSLAQLGR